MSDEALKRAEDALALKRRRLTDVEADETHAFTALVSACHTYDEVRKRWVDTGHNSYYFELKKQRATIWLNALDLVKRDTD